MANVAAGELGVTWGGRDFVFRPSFRALASIGDADHLAWMLNAVQRANSAGFAAAQCVLGACCIDDVSDLIGYYKDVGGRLRYVQKALPWEDVYILGLTCLVNGMVGDITKAKRVKTNGKPPRNFDPAEFAAAAMVHLGMSKDDAWDMTMVEFQRAMITKHPDMVKDIPSKDEYRTAIETVKRIRRRAGHG